MRIFDFCLSGISILILSPIFVVIALLLRMTGEGEIFYRQNRIGLHGKEFKLLKFATMLKNSPNVGSGNITLSDDPRVLPIGRFLSRSKINELPQLLNILLGDMSIIGPRPLTSDNFNYYQDDQKSIITTVKPGLSGIGSIFFRSEDVLLQDQSSAAEFYATAIAPYKAELECWYAIHRTFWLDILLIFETLKVVLLPNRKNDSLWLRVDLPKVPENLRRLID